LGSEDVISVTGQLVKRDAELFNPDIETGELELIADNIEIFNKSKTPPFPIPKEYTDKVDESVRLEYRYLDLRREPMKQRLETRHKMIKFIRDYMDNLGFWEVETPILMKGTPEGSREYIVPSRLHPNNFYVLPQSPQQFKQLLMVSGVEKYFQIAKCFRDEDQRGDRQPEFTQLDIEMSFVDQYQIMDLTQDLIVSLFSQYSNLNIDPNIPKMQYAQVMDLYGTDKPDLRFDLTLNNVTQVFKDLNMEIIQKSLASGQIAKAFLLVIVLGFLERFMMSY